MVVPDRCLVAESVQRKKIGDNPRELKTPTTPCDRAGAEPATQHFVWGPGGRLLRHTYPSGRVLAYTHDTAGRVVSITATAPGGPPRPIVRAARWAPFGDLVAYTLGDGRSRTRIPDAEGRPAALTLGTGTLTLSRDPGGRIVGIADSARPTQNASYAYDGLDRVVRASHGDTTHTRTHTYAWDASGNRAARSTPQGSETLAVDPASNRVAARTPAGAVVEALRPFRYDAAGNLLADGLRSYAYDARGRLAEAILAGAGVRFTVDAAGRRVRKESADPPDVRFFHYDPDGRLIAETRADGSLLREFVYLGTLPVAVLIGGAP